MARKDPNTHVSCYASDGQEVEARVCSSKLNPIHIRIGDPFSTNTTSLYLGIEEAIRLYTALGQALQDHDMRTHNEAAATASTD